MTIKLKKWGNSLGVRIPHTMVKEMELAPEQEYELIQKENEIILRPVSKQPTLDELLAGMSREKRHNIELNDYQGRERWWEENNND